MDPPNKKGFIYYKYKWGTLGKAQRINIPMIIAAHTTGFHSRAITVALDNQPGFCILLCHYIWLSLRHGATLREKC